MNEQTEQLAYYREQHELCKKQDAILVEIKDILFKMRELVECASLNDLSELEKSHANSKMKKWTKEVQLLEKELRSGSLLD